MFAAPPTSAPSVETLDARPKQETHPAGTRTPIAGREARMHERKGLAGQGGHAPPGTSAALKRRSHLGRPKKGAAAGRKPVWRRWKQRQSACSPCRQRRKAHRQGAEAGGRAQLARGGGLRAPSAAARPEAARRPRTRKAGRTGRKRAQNFPRCADDKPAAQTPVAPAASAGRTNRTPQQRDRRRTREERTGARPKRQAHTSAPRYDQGGDEPDRLRRTLHPQARRRAERGAPLWAALAKWPRPCRALAAARGRGFAVSWPGCPLSRVFRVVVG